VFGRICVCSLRVMVNGQCRFSLYSAIVTKVSDVRAIATVLSLELKNFIFGKHVHPKKVMFIYQGHRVVVIEV